MTVPPAVARARFARFIARALRDARERGMTDTQIKAATGISPSTFHKWQSGEGGLPKWEKVAAFCTGLEIPVSAGAAALGISDRAREPEPEPTEDPDLRRLGRILRDPNVPESEKQAIRHTIRMLARATRADTEQP
ncbi:helix-turn-helix domain-containing protein [Micromonospora sp. NPDC047730]|uniref:helix-turn-helix domain-containing protein n=1 Tax=Micromonospora sp. NPDC047730 TaxID=3364253 RepID=UPI0037232BF3